MQAIADIILICGALGVAFYCFVLSRRLSRFNNLEHGVGGAVAVLSAQVDDLTRALERARQAAETSGSSLAELTDRADSVARRLELHMAAMHDLDDRATTPRPAAPDAAPSPAPVPAREAHAPGDDFVASDFATAASAGETARAAMEEWQPATPPAAAPAPSPIPVLAVPDSADVFAVPPHAPDMAASGLTPQPPAARGVRPVSSFFATTATREAAL